ncbi:MAG TPA: cytochrome c3 family protein [Acidobacteriaceae bacterium]|jgi:predicted CXXCH cytochrome family protein|nr:cytochrome c3 family protein [Acidobacteriaceae bacterium]
MKAFLRFFSVLLPGFLLVGPVQSLSAQTDCLTCHGDATMQDASGKSIGVDAAKFHASVHGSLGCNACHSDIKGYPHPDKPAAVQCETCHTDEAKGLNDSVHAKASEHPCLSCHGNQHEIVAKTDPTSPVYPLNIPKTCGSCHGNEAMAKKYGISNVYKSYIDSIHGFAIGKEGLLVAANCTSCHGSHKILSHKDPQSTTFRTNIPGTCGSCHVGINEQYQKGVHGKAVAAGNKSAPVCTDCHTAHGILEPTSADFRMQSTPVCGNCHKDKFSTYRDTFHSQLGLLGGYTETARCWDCHQAHDVRPASDPDSPVAKQNLVATCGRCHAGANASFVQYQPHANARNRRLNPALYYIRLFMNLLLTSVLTFFLLHTVMWLVRSRFQQVSRKPAGGKNE